MGARRQPPEVEPESLDGRILETTYDLIEHLQRLKKSTNRQEMQDLVKLVEDDIAAQSDTHYYFVKQACQRYLTVARLP